MKKAPLALLALGLICCTPQRQDTQYITITTDGVARTIKSTGVVIVVFG